MPRVTLTKVSNGYTVEWENIPVNDPETEVGSGFEVYADKTSAVARVTELMP